MRCWIEGFEFRAVKKEGEVVTSKHNTSLSSPRLTVSQLQGDKAMKKSVTQVGLKTTNRFIYFAVLAALIAVWPSVSFAMGACDYPDMSNMSPLDQFKPDATKGFTTVEDVRLGLTIYNIALASCGADVIRQYTAPGHPYEHIVAPYLDCSGQMTWDRLWRLYEHFLSGERVILTDSKLNNQYPHLSIEYHSEPDGIAESVVVTAHGVSGDIGSTTIWGDAISGVYASFADVESGSGLWIGGGDTPEELSSLLIQDGSRFAMYPMGSGAMPLIDENIITDITRDAVRMFPTLAEVHAPELFEALRLEGTDFDVVADGVVSSADLDLVRNSWGQSGGQGDVTGNGIVDEVDLLAMAIRQGDGVNFPTESSLVDFFTQSKVHHFVLDTASIDLHASYSFAVPLDFSWGMVVKIDLEKYLSELPEPWPTTIDVQFDPALLQAYYIHEYYYDTPVTLEELIEVCQGKKEFTQFCEFDGPDAGFGMGGFMLGAGLTLQINGQPYNVEVEMMPAEMFEIMEREVVSLNSNELPSLEMGLHSTQCMKTKNLKTKDWMCESKACSVYVGAVSKWVTLGFTLTGECGWFNSKMSEWLGTGRSCRCIIDL